MLVTGLVCLSPDRLATLLTAAATWWGDWERCMPGRLWLDRWHVVVCRCATLLLSILFPGTFFNQMLEFSRNWQRFRHCWISLFLP